MYVSPRLIAVVFKTERGYASSGEGTFSLGRAWSDNGGDAWSDGGSSGGNTLGGWSDNGGSAWSD